MEKGKVKHRKHKFSFMKTRRQGAQNQIYYCTKTYCNHNSVTKKLQLPLKRLLLEPGPRPWTQTLDLDPEKPAP